MPIPLIAAALGALASGLAGGVAAGHMQNEEEKKKQQAKAGQEEAKSFRELASKGMLNPDIADLWGNSLAQRGIIGPEETYANTELNKNLFQSAAQAAQNKAAFQQLMQQYLSRKLGVQPTAPAAPYMSMEEFARRHENGGPEALQRPASEINGPFGAVNPAAQRKSYISGAGGASPEVQQQAQARYPSVPPAVATTPSQPSTPSIGGVPSIEKGLSFHMNKEGDITMDLSGVGEVTAADQLQSFVSQTPQMTWSQRRDLVSSGQVQLHPEAQKIMDEQIHREADAAFDQARGVINLASPTQKIEMQRKAAVQVMARYGVLPKAAQALFDPTNKVDEQVYLQQAANDFSKLDLSNPSTVQPGWYNRWKQQAGLIGQPFEKQFDETAAGIAIPAYVNRLRDQFTADPANRGKTINEPLLRLQAIQRVAAEIPHLPQQYLTEIGKDLSQVTGIKDPYTLNVIANRVAAGQIITQDIIENALHTSAELEREEAFRKKLTPREEALYDQSAQAPKAEAGAGLPPPNPPQPPVQQSAPAPAAAAAAATPSTEAKRQALQQADVETAQQKERVAAAEEEGRQSTKQPPTNDTDAIETLDDVYHSATRAISVAQRVMAKYGKHMSGTMMDFANRVAEEFGASDPDALEFRTLVSEGFTTMKQKISGAAVPPGERSDIVGFIPDSSTNVNTAAQKLRMLARKLGFVLDQKTSSLKNRYPSWNPDYLFYQKVRERARQSTEEAGKRREQNEKEISKMPVPKETPKESKPSGGPGGQAPEPPMHKQSYKKGPPDYESQHPLLARIRENPDRATASDSELHGYGLTRADFNKLVQRERERRRKSGVGGQSARR